ncbi:13595_t:CDS:2, partial [Racocetra persica]
QFYKASQIENVDLIVGNPPWSIFGVSRNIGGNNLNVCALMANVVASRKLNYQMGCLAFIMPKSLLFNASYEGFRPFILENGKRLYLQKHFNFDNVKKPFEEVELKFGVYFYSSQEIEYRKGVEQVIFSSKEKLQDKKSSLLVSIQKKSNAFSVVENKEELENFKLIQGEFAYKFRTG